MSAVPRIVTVALLLSGLCSASVRAAELQLQAPDECPSAEAVRAQVERLAGRPLEQLGAVAFEVSIARRKGRYRAEIRRHVAGVRRGGRVLLGSSCAQAADAVAVAVALALDEDAQASPATPELEPGPVSEPGPASEPALASEPRLASSEPGPASSEPGSASEPGLASESTSETESDGASAWSLRAGLGPGLDLGMLPAATPGIVVALQLSYGGVGVRGQGSLFAPVRENLPGFDVSGDLELATLGVLVCADRRRGLPQIAGCAGAEAARVAGSGQGRELVRDYSRSVLLPTLRAEVGAGLPLTASLGVWLRGGVAVPLERPRFVFGGDRLLHRVGSMALRASLELELTL